MVLGAGWGWTEHGILDKILNYLIMYFLINPKRHTSAVQNVRFNERKTWVLFEVNIFRVKSRVL